MSPFLTHRGILVLIAAMLYLLSGTFAQSMVIFWIGEGVLLTLVLSYFVNLDYARKLERRLINIEVTRGDGNDLSPISIGQPGTIRVQLSNLYDSTLPVLLFEPELASQLRITDHRPIKVSLPPRGKAEFTFDVVGRSTGRWFLHGFHVKLQGPVGLFQVADYFKAPFRLKFLSPTVMTRKKLTHPSLNSSQDMVGSHFVKRRGFGLDLRELRDHQHGDSFRMIAWKATARAGKLMVREFESELTFSAYLLIDISSTMRGQKLEHVLKLAMTYIRTNLKNNDRVGLISFDSQVYGHLPAKKGNTHLNRVINHLLGLNNIIDEMVTEYDDEQITEHLIRYLQLQERLDFTVNPNDRMGVSPEEKFNTPLLNRWMKRTLKNERELLYDSCLDVGVPFYNDISIVRKFVHLRGIEIPYLTEAHWGFKERGLVSALETVCSVSRDKTHIIVLSDLAGIIDIAHLKRGAKLVRARKHELTVLLPYTPYYVNTESTHPRWKILHRLFAMAEKRDRAQLVSAVEGLGVRVLPISPTQNLAMILRKLPRR